MRHFFKIVFQIGAVVGPIITLGFMALDMYQLSTMGLPVAAWSIIGLSVFFVSVIGLVYGINSDNEALKIELKTLQSIRQTESPRVIQTHSSKEPVRTSAEQGEATLRVIVTRTASHARSEFDMATESVHDHNAIVEYETTLIPSRPLQVVRVSLTVDEHELDMLGPPIYAETIHLPMSLEREETCLLRFEVPHVYRSKQDVHGKVRVFAAGKYWFSDEVKIGT